MEGFRRVRLLARRRPARPPGAGRRPGLGRVPPAPPAAAARARGGGRAGAVRGGRAHLHGGGGAIGGLDGDGGDGGLGGGAGDGSHCEGVGRLEGAGTCFNFWALLPGEVSLTPVSLAGRTRMKASLAVRFPKSGILSRSETPFRPLGGSERRSPRGRTKVSEGPPYPDTERGTREGLQAGQPLQLQLRRWERTGRGGFSPSPPRRRGGGKGPSERFSIPLRRSVCRRRSLGARGGDHATGPGAISHDMRKSGGSIHPQKPSDLGKSP